MKKEVLRNVQRTLVVAWGDLAHDAGRRLAQLLAREDGAAGAVAIVPLHETDGEAKHMDALRQGMVAISQVSMREMLAQRGWTLDRLDEIAVALLLDLSAPDAVETAAALATQTAQLARQHLGLEAAILLMALAPSPEDRDVESAISGLAAMQQEYFTRGVVAMQPVNEDGLCLAGSEALAEGAARALFALSATPLRDALAWLSEQEVMAGECTLTSIGINWCAWSPLAERVAVGRSWMQQALAHWLMDDNTADDARGAVERWLASEAVELEQLLGRLDDARREALPPATPFPQPWRVRTTYAPYCREDEAGLAVWRQALAVRREALGAQAAAHLQQQARAGLDAQPVGSIRRLQKFAGLLLAHLQAFGDRLAGFDEKQAERVAALEAARGQLVAQMEKQLADWPGDGLRAAVSMALRPWQWVRLARRYLGMHKLARHLAQVNAELQQWRRQRLRLAAAGALYTHLEDETRKIQVQAEELEEMLQSVQRSIEGMHIHLPALLEGREDYLEARLRQVGDSPTLEGMWAAEAIGGLGRQLEAPDDAFVDALLQMVDERIATQGVFTLAEALELLYPEDEARWAWWQRQWEAAAPL